MREPQARGGERGDEHALLVSADHGVERLGLRPGDDGLGGLLRRLRSTTSARSPIVPDIACRRSEATTTSASSARDASRKSLAR